MRTLILLAFLFLSLAATGCAGGFRIGGNHFGAGIGAYIGPVPDAVKPDRPPDHSYYPPDRSMDPPGESR